MCNPLAPEHLDQTYALLTGAEWNRGNTYDRQANAARVQAFALLAINENLARIATALESREGRQ